MDRLGRGPVATHVPSRRWRFLKYTPFYPNRKTSKAPRGAPVFVPFPMAMDSNVAAVLGRYPPDCAPHRIEPLGGAGGFSGSKFWRIDAPRGGLCLRQWPLEHPSPERLELIHTVLRHAVDNGFRRLPLPIASIGGTTWVEHFGRLWELAPWMPGEIDRIAAPNPARVAAALRAGRVSRGRIDIPVVGCSVRAVAWLDRANRAVGGAAGGRIERDRAFTRRPTLAGVGPARPAVFVAVSTCRAFGQFASSGRDEARDPVAAVSARYLARECAICRRRSVGDSRLCRHARRDGRRRHRPADRQLCRR